MFQSLIDSGVYITSAAPYHYSEKQLVHVQSLNALELKLGYTTTSFTFENYSLVAKLSVRNQKPALQKRPPQ